MDAAELMQRVQDGANLLAAFDAHIAQVEAERAAVRAAFMAEADQENFFHYVANDNGVIAIDQDAEFVAAVMILTLPASGVTQFGSGFGFSDFLLAVEDESSRALTTGHRYRGSNNLNTVFAASPLLNTTEIPGAVFSPLSGNGSDVAGIAPNYDVIHTLITEWLMPRAAAARFRFTDSRGNPLTGTLPQVSLVGRKVF